MSVSDYPCLRVTLSMSPKTLAYVEAMIREGDNFDYDDWLKRTRAEFIDAERVSQAAVSPQAMPEQVRNRQGECDSGGGRVAPGVAKLLPLRGPSIASMLKFRDSGAKARRVVSLGSVRAAWDDFQASRARDAVYGYLEAVFAIVEHYKVRRRTKRLLRHAFKFADHPRDDNADPFTAVIRCTCGGAADNKMISKWARALRYVARCKEPEARLKAFMKDAGGVNACATRYAILKRCRNRRN
jgi:hypothetical protein